MAFEYNMLLIFYERNLILICYCNLQTSEPFSTDLLGMFCLRYDTILLPFAIHEHIIIFEQIPLT